MPVDFETLPMILKVGSRFAADLYHIGHSLMSLHLDELKSIICRDIAYLRNQAKTNIKKYNIKNTLTKDYRKSMRSVLLV